MQVLETLLSQIKDDETWKNTGIIPQCITTAQFKEQEQIVFGFELGGDDAPPMWPVEAPDVLQKRMKYYMEWMLESSHVAGAQRASALKDCVQIGSDRVCIRRAGLLKYGEFFYEEWLPTQLQAA